MKVRCSPDCCGRATRIEVKGLTPLQVALNIGNRRNLKALVAAGANTRGRSEPQLLMELKRKDVVDFEPDCGDMGEADIVPARLPDLRTPLGVVDQRFFNQLLAQSFSYFGCYPEAFSDDGPFEVFAIVSQEHGAFAPLVADMASQGVWVSLQRRMR